ncbi:maleylpyruvate isomerase family mycothiol-dependent enzyme [Nocardioides mangrovi]|uniref:Maleylpyruvate isomerase family mycothiol-dependent enzyme n=1 Tax=Nocardioides mangrovi TaxID=2874580 RepID=A0ABS7U916_9ACTN|nr:maleylpyruvate isomerase family mycothiol-dependent enzyme [Nocardioides mangrovi]MBZ5737469.1 maleylpyruvate isomerase family mycothiol-dependent enzyme [Nocardioides mangrovi]
MDPWSQIAAERRSLADLLDGLTAAQWATPSLCGAWTVKEVAVHLTSGPSTSALTLLKAIAAGRGSFDRANQLLVRWRADAEPEQVTAWLREYADHRFTPPTMDWHAPLTDLRIHTQDMLVPLGLDAAASLEPWRDVLDFLVSSAARRGFVPKGRPGLAVTATDLDWSHGSGERVAGPARALAMALSGRSALLDQLDGDGVPALRAWCGNP